MAGTWVYHNSLHGPFIFDDRGSILANPTILHLWPPWDALSPPSRSPPPAVAGRPFVNLTLALNYAFGGFDVQGYHVFNLALHILAALTLFGIVRRTLLRPQLRSVYGAQAQWIALAVALAWIVHPLQTESVTYVIQRTELLMGLCFLLTLYCVLRGADSPRPPAWYGAAVASSALGMASKEVMASAPLVVLLYDRVFLSGSFREAVRRRWGLHAGLAASWLILAALVGTSHRSRSVAFGFATLTPWDYARTQSGVILHYLRLCFWPRPLVLDYEDWPVARTAAAVLPSAAGIGVLGAATVAALRRWPPVGFLGAWFFLILAPTSSFIPIVTEIAAERRMYLPLAAVVTLVVIGVHAGLERVRRCSGSHGSVRAGLEASFLIGVVATLGYATLQRNEDYRGTLSIWADTVAKRPSNARARLNLGDYLYKHGQLEEARTHFAEAVRIAPQNAEARYGLGVVLAAQGHREEAIEQYQAALRIKPGYAEAHNGLGAAFVTQGRAEDAIVQYSEALRINPRHANAHYNLGLALASQGRIDEAIAHHAEAVRIEPNFPEAHYSLGAFLAKEGKIDEAMRHLETAVRLRPNFEPARRELDALRGRAEEGHARE